MISAINIIVSDEGTFAEIEDDSGKSISIGKWIPSEDGSYYKIRITMEDMKNFQHKTKEEKKECDCESERCGICSQLYCDHIDCKCVEWKMR